MIRKLLSMSIEEIKNGYSYDGQNESYICNVCGKEFEKGEIFEAGGRFYDAARMVRLHIRKEHTGMLDVLISNNKKYTGLTENQKDLLKMMSSGMTDNDIAKKTGVSPATVRHQRFVFREKAKQAKLFLAIYELVIQGAEKEKTGNEKEEIIEAHKGATMIDDRYFTTRAEDEKVIANMFSSLSPLKLKVFPAKEKNKIIVLRRISRQFEKDKRYCEKDVNEIIKPIFEDFATIRRYLIEYGFMERTNDCKEYWLK